MRIRQRSHGIVLGCLLLLVLSSLALGSADPPAAVPHGERLVPAPNPMMVEIQELLESEQAGIERLRSGFESATDEKTALEHQRAIEALKRSTETAILKVQLHYAREAGAVDTIGRLEEALRVLDDARSAQE